MKTFTPSAIFLIFVFTLFVVLFLPSTVAVTIRGEVGKAAIFRMPLWQTSSRRPKLAIVRLPPSRSVHDVAGAWSGETRLCRRPLVAWKSFRITHYAIPRRNGAQPFLNGGAAVTHPEVNISAPSRLPSLPALPFRPSSSLAAPRLSPQTPY